MQPVNPQSLYFLPLTRAARPAARTANLGRTLALLTERSGYVSVDRPAEPLPIPSEQRDVQFGSPCT